MPFKQKEIALALGSQSAATGSSNSSLKSKVQEGAKISTKSSPDALFLWDYNKLLNLLMRACDNPELANLSDKQLNDLYRRYNLRHDETNADGELALLTRKSHEELSKLWEQLDPKDPVLTPGPPLSAVEVRRRIAMMSAEDQEAVAKLDPVLVTRVLEMGNMFQLPSADEFGLGPKFDEDLVSAFRRANLGHSMRPLDLEHDLQGSTGEECDGVENDDEEDDEEEEEEGGEEYDEGRTV